MFMFVVITQEREDMTMFVVITQEREDMIMFVVITQEREDMFMLGVITQEREDMFMFVLFCSVLRFCWHIGLCPKIARECPDEIIITLMLL